VKTHKSYIIKKRSNNKVSFVEFIIVEWRFDSEQNWRCPVDWNRSPDEQEASWRYWHSRARRHTSTPSSHRRPGRSRLRRLPTASRRCPRDLDWTPASAPSDPPTTSSSSSSSSSLVIEELYQLNKVTSMSEIWTFRPLLLFMHPPTIGSGGIAISGCQTGCPSVAQPLTP